MITFVNKRSELTAKKEAFEAKGLETYRTRIDCNCPSPKNRRNGVLVISKTGQLQATVIRCKGCVIQKGGQL